MPCVRVPTLNKWSFILYNRPAAVALPICLIRLAKLDAEDHRLMRTTAGDFLTETFILTLGGKRLDAAFRFPDYSSFILGLFFLQPRLKPRLWQTSAFTVAHSITLALALALAVLGMIEVPAKVVEPMIALSIAYVGIENLEVKELKPWRVALVFGLGLLHGMGFASVMKELALPEGQIIEPLVGFNLEVELGQLTVLGLAFAATFWLLKKKAFGVASKFVSGGIAIVGLYWTFQRIFQ